MLTNHCATALTIFLNAANNYFFVIAALTCLGASAVVHMLFIICSSYLQSCFIWEYFIMGVWLSGCIWPVLTLEMQSQPGSSLVRRRSLIEEFFFLSGYVWVPICIWGANIRLSFSGLLSQRGVCCQITLSTVNTPFFTCPFITNAQNNPINRSVLYVQRPAALSLNQMLDCVAPIWSAVSITGDYDGEVN